MFLLIGWIFKKPCITLRDETELVELVEDGFNVVVGGNAESIIVAEKELHLKSAFPDTELYGNGQAGNKIIKILYDHL